MSSHIPLLDLHGLVLSVARLPDFLGNDAKWLEALLSPTSLLIFGVGFLGLIVGWLLGSPQPPKEEPQPEREPIEWQWRHEKLVLMERQQAERQRRLDDFTETLLHSGLDPDSRLRVATYAFGERLRGMRQRVGTDISRLTTVQERLLEVDRQASARPDAIEGCLEIAENQLSKLREIRVALQSMAVKFSQFEPLDFLEEDKGDQVVAWGESKKQVEELMQHLRDSPIRWQQEPGASEAQIREILRAGGESDFDLMCRVLLVDGSETNSLPQRGRDLHSSAQQMNQALTLWTPGSEESESAPAQPDKSEGAEAPPLLTYTIKPKAAPAPAADQAPVEELQDSVSEKEEHHLFQQRAGTTFSEAPHLGFLPPVQFPPPIPGVGGASSLANSSPSLVPTGTVSAEKAPLIVFRSNNAAIWGQDVYRSASHRARAITDLPAWVNWVSIERTDTHERVFTQVNEVRIHGQAGASVGFNGSNELFYGARHLGVYSDLCPNEIETRFTYGGWGFGHRVNGSDREQDGAGPQASGWEGREIPSDTVFEIVYHHVLPELTPKDKILESYITETWP